MEQLGSYWTDFHGIWCYSTGNSKHNVDDTPQDWRFSIFRKPAEKIRVSLKSYKNKEKFPWRPVYIYDNISLNSSQNEKCFGHTYVVVKNKTQFYIQFPPISQTGHRRQYHNKRERCDWHSG
jgi:hypothetical protein